MSMKIVFLKEYKGYRLSRDEKLLDKYNPLDEAIVSRQMGQMLVYQEFAIPVFRKELNPIYKDLISEQKKKELIAAKRKQERSKAISKKAKTREIAVQEQSITEPLT